MTCLRLVRYTVRPGDVECSGIVDWPVDTVVDLLPGTRSVTGRISVTGSHRNVEYSGIVDWPVGTVANLMPGGRPVMTGRPVELS